MIGKVLVGTQSDDLWGIEEGVKYTIQEHYFGNGECSFVMMDENGKQHDLPEVIVETLTTPLTQAAE